ncbi:HAMP domain-containing histidine kinase [Sporosarcina sp. ACRSM]|nr:HAMP domain-containing sensor histidine kinase [Sporosarcina sp. ACRSM]MCG7336961.1 HAMP domain-containing histidine kinase [Sporosarcina sp. ACRSM]
MERKFRLFETLLLNFLFLLLPVLISVIFFENKWNTFNKFSLIFWSSVSLLLCMAFPLKLEIGFMFDLRWIPFIVVALFGGYKMALPLYIVLNVYRYLIGGGDGFYHSLAFATVILLVIPFFREQFIVQTPNRRVAYGIIATLSMMALYFTSLGFFYEELTDEFWELVINSLLTYTVVIFIIMSLIEKIISNVKRREIYIQSERLKDISELSASIAHEIRNPLTVTNGFLQLLNSSKTITPEEKRYIDFSLTELERAETIVNDFLAFSKPQSIHMVYSNFKDELEYVKNILGPYATKNNVAIHIECTNKLKKSYDESQVRQCFINLIKNSIESMKEEGGNITIDISAQNSNILIEVKDSGIGMTSEELSQLGVPYYSTKKEGTGLGMFMVYRTINSLNGKIEVESTLGKGTTMLITIPV